MFYCLGSCSWTPPDFLSVWLDNGQPHNLNMWTMPSCEAIDVNGDGSPDFVCSYQNWVTGTHPNEWKKTYINNGTGWITGNAVNHRDSMF
jgi:hypothetical protein